jgi:hypothetical protein
MAVKWLVVGRAFDRGVVRTAAGNQRLPVLDRLRGVAVNLEPRERVAEDVAMRERALRAWARGEIA